MNADKIDEWNRKVRTLYTWSHLYLGFKVAQVHSRMLPQQKRAAFWKHRHSKFAQAIWSNIADLRGWWVKVGQFLSTRADLLPDEYVSELAKVQDMMPTSAFDVVRAIIESELGKPLEEVFEFVEEKALASASIGQVHKAKLLTGEMVVVKVQHPNVDKMLSQDMALLGQLSWAFGLLERGLSFTSVLEEWQKQAAMELDFTFEAANQERVRLAMIKAGIDVKIPLCYTQFTTRKVVVMEFIDGFKCTDQEQLKKHNVDVDELCSQITRSFAYQIHIDGLFNGDPHPGNIMVEIDKVTGKPRPVLLDWGLVKEFTERERLAFARLITSISQVDVMGLMGAFQEMGFKFKKPTVAARKHHVHKSSAHGHHGGAVQEDDTDQSPIPIDPEIYMDAITVLFTSKKSPSGFEGGGEPAAPAFSQSEKDEAWAQAKKTKMSDVQASNPLDDWPKDIIFFLRVASLLHGLTTQLNARVPFFQIMLERAEEAVRADRGDIPKLLYYVYKAHGAIATAAKLRCPYQYLVFGQHLPEVTKMLGLMPTSILQSPGMPLPPGMDDFRPRSLLEWKLFKVLATFFSNGLLVGIQVSVWHRKSQRVDINLGKMGVYDQRPVTPRTLFTMFSLTNVILVTMILHLISRQKLRLTDCISEWWDGFVRNDKRNITVEHLLTHQSGLHTWLPSTLTLSQMANYKHMIKIAENATPQCTPGHCGHYPHVCVSYLYNELVQSVTKTDSGKFLRSTCLREWRLKHLSKSIYFPIPARSASRMSTPKPVDMLEPQQPHTTSPDPAEALMTTPELKTPSPAEPAKSEQRRTVHERSPTDEREAHTSPDSSNRYEAELDSDTLARQLELTRKLPPDVIKEVLENAQQAKELPDLGTWSSSMRNRSDVFTGSMGSRLLRADTSGLFASPMASVDAGRDLTPGVAPADGGPVVSEVMTRLATVSRDLGVAKMADAANMNLQTIGASTDATSLMTPDERLRIQKRQEWLKHLYQMKAAPPKAMLSKFPGREPMMTEYLRKKQLQDSKLAALQALFQQHVEGLTAFQLARKRPHLFDPLFFNAPAVASIPIPHGNGRTTAKALATILHYVGRGGLLREKLLNNAISPRCADLSLEARVATGGWVPVFGLGYQLLPYVRTSEVKRYSAKEALVSNANFEIMKESTTGLSCQLQPEAAKELEKMPPRPFRVTAAAAGRRLAWTSSNVTVSVGRPAARAAAAVSVSARAAPTAVTSGDESAAVTEESSEFEDVEPAPDVEPTGDVEPTVDGADLAAVETDRGAARGSVAVAESSSDEGRDGAGPPPASYGFGGSDTGGNLCFSFPAEQLTVCVLVNDHVSGSFISRVVLLEALRACGLAPRNSFFA